MTFRIATALIGLLALTEPQASVEITLDHRAFDERAEGSPQMWELSGTLKDGAGKGKLSGMVLSGGDRNFYGDLVGHPGWFDRKDYDITLKKLNPGDPVGLRDFEADPSPAKDRSLYLIKGVDLGRRRTLLLIVSSKGPQRLVILNHCGGVDATLPLESRSVFAGPVRPRD